MTDVLSDIHDLEMAYRAAWQTYITLHESLPVNRNRQQQMELDTAYSALSWANWKLGQAEDWTAYHSRESVHSVS